MSGDFGGFGQLSLGAALLAAFTALPAGETSGEGRASEIGSSDGWLSTLEDLDSETEAGISSGESPDDSALARARTYAWQPPLLGVALPARNDVQAAVLPATRSDAAAVETLPALPDVAEAVSSLLTQDSYQARLVPPHAPLPAADNTESAVGAQPAALALPAAPAISASQSTRQSEQQLAASGSLQHASQLPPIRLEPLPAEDRAESQSEEFVPARPTSTLCLPIEAEAAAQLDPEPPVRSAGMAAVSAAMATAAVGATTAVNLLVGDAAGTAPRPANAGPTDPRVRNSDQDQSFEQDQRLQSLPVTRIESAEGLASRARPVMLVRMRPAEEQAAEMQSSLVEAAGAGDAVEHNVLSPLMLQPRPIASRGQSAPPMPACAQTAPPETRRLQTGAAQNDTSLCDASQSGSSSEPVPAIARTEAAAISTSGQRSASFDSLEVAVSGPLNAQSTDNFSGASALPAATVPRPAANPSEQRPAVPASTRPLASAPSETAESASQRLSSGMNQINLRLDLPQSDPVHLRFVERAGEIHVVVRSDQPGASTRLASGLEEFQRDIGSGGSQVETWVTPPEEVSVAATAPDPTRGEREPLASAAAAERSFSGLGDQTGGSQRGRGSMSEWAELLSEREDESALRRLRSAAQGGQDAWRQ